MHRTAPVSFGEFRDWPIVSPAQSFLASWSILFLIASAVLALFGIWLVAKILVGNGRRPDTGKVLVAGIFGFLWLLPFASAIAIFAAVARPALFPVPVHRPPRLSTILSAVRHATQKVEGRLVGYRASGNEPDAPTLPPVAAPAPAAPAPPATSPSTKAPSAVMTSELTNATVAAAPMTPATSAESQVPAWATVTETQQDRRRLVVVTSDIEATPQLAEAAALEMADKVVREDFEQFYPAAGNAPSPLALVRIANVRQIYVEPLDRQTLSSATHFRVYRAYAQVELSEASRQKLFENWKQTAVDRRMKALGGLAGLLTLTFGALAAYFRLDDRTGGQHRVRLKLAAVSIVAAGACAAGVFVS
jgi:hypothetical protein